MGSSFVYYYNPPKPGTFFYHCHVEASEHMQMGMLGNLYVRPAQNKMPDGTVLGAHTHDNPDYSPDPWLDDATVGDKYVYNDGDGSTLYDVEYPLMLGGFDSRFHDASLNVQPLPFAAMEDNYPMLNGRGYPDTIDPDPLMNNASAYAGSDYEAQIESSLITATQGQKILLRIANISTTDEFSIATTLGVPMKVVGQGADLLRGPATLGTLDLSYEVEVLHTGGGEQYDVIIDTADVDPGTYCLYATNSQFLCNYTEERGGMMTEIVVSPAI
jgi:FtsP/CotA-like multicopper oxidase with cupredoxin domain